MYVRGSGLAPVAGNGGEDFWPFLDKLVLIKQRKFHHAVGFVRIGKRCENLSGHAEVRVVHVLSFHGFRKAECETTKFIWCHSSFLRKYLRSPTLSTASR